jgi:hypothetical protein
MSDWKEEKTVAWLKTIDLQASVAKLVDIDKIHSPFELATAKEIDLNSKVVEFMLNSISNVDMVILYKFQEDFGAWPEQTWEATHQTIRGRFRVFLREHGSTPDR